MLNFYNSGSIQTKTVWPEVSSSLALLPSGKIELLMIQDYDKSETIVPATLINVPTPAYPRIVFQVLTTDLPAYGGLYSVKIREYLAIGIHTWGNYNKTWAEADRIWSAKAKVDLTQIDEDRATVQGLDTVTFIQYTGPDETGAYITYHK